MRYPYWFASTVLALILAVGQLLTDTSAFTAGAETGSICETVFPATPVSTVVALQGSVESAPFDVRFIDLMIANHAGAIAMASVALQQAQDSQVRRLALRVAESQAGEIQILRHWRETWYPAVEQTSFSTNESDSPTPFEAGDNSPIAMLCAAGGDFDRVFLEMMILNLNASISLADLALEQAQHKEIVAFAQSIIEVQSDEVSMMTRLLEEMTAAPSAAG